MAPTNNALEVQLKSIGQAVEAVKAVKQFSQNVKPEETLNIKVSLAPKTRVEIAAVSSLIQYACHIVQSEKVHDVLLDFSQVKLPFTFPNKSIREILFANHESSIALELTSKDCRLTVFRKNNHDERDDWYENIKNWRKDLPNKFHLMLNELVENVPAHAQLPADKFCFTVGLLFSTKKLYYCVADNGVGLHGSLKEAIVPDAKDVASRACALHLTRAQVTSKGIERGHQGVGLFITSELATMNKGYLEILSGVQEYEQRDTTVTSVRGIAEWEGTMVHGAINLDQEFNYRRAMKLFAEPSTIIKDRFLVCQISLNVYGQRSLRTRELCEEIMHDLDIAAERSSKIILDFKDIEEISQAFHGFLRKFVTDHKKIRIMIMVPPDADDELKEDLGELNNLANENWVDVDDSSDSSNSS
ncbi:11559_t:CDS:2 [Ambispora gerdemannii]|uniref:11559_t:CDS:1 n=1 Tax=Ambispora gerdemannii TaxID=144530 RepID=A0A9N8V8A1_9GLOM|nr:11559_t:CDS:2 [Ambispora gerdemannii]